MTNGVRRGIVPGEVLPAGVQTGRPFLVLTDNSDDL
jgi:hypothetical protein